MRGYQALDLGHVEIQYEDYLWGITSKQTIPEKYVNESNQVFVPTESDEEYNNQIIRSFA